EARTFLTVLPFGTVSRGRAAHLPLDYNTTGQALSSPTPGKRRDLPPLFPKKLGLFLKKD
ncbi:MAG: hypothetical protein J6T24_06665, partial [Clostridia bacterium]|nr:hypothetical protein [Clostridia bacterium]